MTPTWYAGSLASIKLHKPSAVPLMVRDPVQFGWMAWHVPETSHISTTVATKDGENMIAVIAETPVCNAILFV